ncbi:MULTISPECIES: response regulator [unclassified Anabaena]|uniref:response regulator n=1 Tax=unclassified Anabaena TaxID=2619674 RepID=UPI002B202CC1|nr:response regulator [Anabaena sp. UHCC 0399]MEA5565959.1 response regulator [Anabaena sp. UHCC 0399]
MNLTIAGTSEVEILKGVQILVVDNDLDSGVLYSIFLEDFGANVIASGSIKEALEILSWFVPNMIICEITFLGESIYTLLNKLNAMEADNGNHIPIIVTSTCTRSSITTIPEIEFERYLLKPIDLDQLILIINNLVLSNENNSSVSVIEKRCSNLMAVKDVLVLEAEVA